MTEGRPVNDMHYIRAGGDAVKYTLIQYDGGIESARIETDNLALAKEFYSRSVGELSAVRVWADGRKLGILEADKLFGVNWDFMKRGTKRRSANNE